MANRRMSAPPAIAHDKSLGRERGHQSDVTIRQDLPLWCLELEDDSEASLSCISGNRAMGYFVTSGCLFHLVLSHAALCISV